MKKYLIISALFLASCTNPKQESPKPEVYKIDNQSDSYAQHYNVYTLDGCEYIVVGIGNNRWGSHKGNCSNPIHKTQRYTEWKN